jgi:hypothetical protein
LPPQPDKVVGAVVDWRSGYLNVEVEEPDSLLGTQARIPLELLARLEVNRGHKRRTLVGAGIGFLVGSVTSVIIWGSAKEADDTSVCNPYVWAASAGLGTPLGAGIGSMVRVERWVEVPVADLELAITAHGQGHLALRVSFPAR